jgi:hypothetical protein
MSRPVHSHIIPIVNALCCLYCLHLFLLVFELEALHLTVRCHPALFWVGIYPHGSHRGFDSEPRYEL